MAGKNKIMQAVVSFAGTIDPSLGKAMDNVAGHLDKVNWKAVAVGAAVAAAVLSGDCVAADAVSSFGSRLIFMVLSASATVSRPV